MPVSLSNIVSRVTWAGRAIGVEMPAGRIDARAVIVTVSVNVLTAGYICFTPELPKRSARRGCEIVARQLRSHRAGAAQQSTRPWTQ